MAKMLKAGVIGLGMGGNHLAGYLAHPDVEVVAATTTSEAGTPVSAVHRDLLGETDLCFGLVVRVNKCSLLRVIAFIIPK